MGDGAMSRVDEYGRTILTDEEFGDALRRLGARIATYAEKHPEAYARHCANRERESEAERWGDDDGGAGLMAP